MNEGKKREKTKYQNRGLVLKLIATGQCTSRIELAKEMHFSKMSISNMVNELMEQNFLVEKETDKTETVGRNPIVLDISPKCPKVAGLLIFRDRCESVLCDFKLQVLKRRKIGIHNIGKEELCETIYKVIDEVIEGEQVLGIGAACIGPIHISQGELLNPSYFYNISHVPVVKILKERYKLPIYFDNDNQCGVLAEKLFGYGKNYNDILFLGIGEGIGCGIISQNKRLGNTQGFTPEFGHISIDYAGRECFCGSRGCIETYLRTPVLLKSFQEITHLNLSYEEFCKQAKTNKKLDECFRKAMDNLAIAIVAVLNILNSELILIGYDGFYWDKEYLKLLEEKTNQYRYKDKGEVIVRHPYFGMDSQLLGGACTVLDSIFNGELLGTIMK